MIEIKVSTSDDNHNVNLNLTGGTLDIINEMAAANVAFVNKIKTSGRIKDEATKNQIMFTILGVVMKMFDKDGQKELGKER